MLFRICHRQPTAELSLARDYLVTALRLAVGDRFEVISGGMKVFVYEITHIAKQVTAVQVAAYDEWNEPAQSVSLVQPLLKSDKLDYVLQKATELGVSAFYLYVADDSPIKIANIEVKLERWQAIVDAAVCQSRRSHIPRIAVYTDLAAAVQELSDPLYYAHWVPGAAVLASTAGDRAIAIGPESGFSEQELHVLQVKGVPVVLGPTVLRSETASIAASAVCLLGGR